MDDARRGHDLGRAVAGHRDAVLVDLGGQALGEALERRLLGAVEGTAGELRAPVGTAARADRGARRDVDDAAGAPLDHLGQHELREVERRVEVDRGRAMPLVDREIDDRDEVGQSCVVDQHIDQPERVADFVHQALAVRVLRDVAGERSRVAAGRPDLLDRLLQRPAQVVAALGQGARRAGDPCAVLGEQLGDRLADAAARSGDQGYLAFELLLGLRHCASSFIRLEPSSAICVAVPLA